MFPQLVRRLIRANAASDAKVGFPTSEDAQLPGWDGIVDNPKPSAYVPVGDSGWELSTEANPQTKAERDYQKRKADPLGRDPATTTFVFVTAKRWAKKLEWVAAKRQEGFWSDVVAYDAIDLEQWFEMCPEVAIWFSAQTGRVPRGVQSLVDFWNEYRHSTDPVMPPDLLIAGRKKEAETVAQWLQAGSGVLRVLADSADEALAFVSAVAVMNQASSANRDCAEIIVATDAEQIRQLMGTSHQLTFGWRIDDPSLLGIVVDKRHRALVPLNRSAGSSEHADVELPRQGRAEFVAAIKDALPRQPIDTTEDAQIQEQARRKEETKREEEANRRARKCGRSITVYRRMFAAHGVAQLPAWATPERAQELVPVLLAGGWSETNKSDQRAISKLAGTGYEGVSKTLMGWVNQPDAPIRRIGDAWSLVAPLDAWSVLSRFISESVLERFSETVQDVLGESDPKLQLAPSERWLANLHGKEFNYSSALRQGLAESLILLAVVGEESRLNVSHATVHLSHRLVAKLLDAKAGEKRWASMSELLPWLAEAGPEAFLDALGADLSLNSPNVLCLFEDEDRPLGGGSRHPHLLWALETLAWDPNYLSRVALILAKLERLAPEIKIVNSPHNSLCEIFCTWHRNTAASLDHRLRTLDRLFTQEPEVAWGLLLDLLPRGHAVSGSTAGPRWRVKPDIEPVTYGEARCAHEEHVNLAIRFAEIDGKRLSQLVSKIASWSPEERQRFLRCVEKFSKVSLDVAARTALWKSVLEFVSRHRSFRNAGWALPEPELTPFDGILDSLKPSDIGESNCWLFDNHLPDLPDSKGGSFEDRQKEVGEARQKAVGMIMQQQGLDGLLALARRVKLPWEIGISLAEIGTNPQTERELLERTLATENSNERKFGRGFVVRSYSAKGTAWSEQFLRSDVFKSWCPSRQADFCLCLPEEPSTWRLVSTFGSKVEAKYWAQTFVFLSRLDNETDAEFAIAKLLGCGRALYAFDQAALNPEKLSLATLIEILKNALSELAKAGDKLSVGAEFAWGLERIFEKLRKSGEIPDAVLGKLEWQYLPLLRFEAQPVTLHRLLQNDPEFFATLVAHAFKSELEESDTLTPSDVSEEEKRIKARLAWDVLESWHTPPGSMTDGTIDPGKLNSWVRDARSLCSAQNRTASGDDRIGKVLSHAPPDSDGIWPPSYVRELIEEIESRYLDSGLHSGKFNQRGSWARSPLEGGRQEREIAKTYRNWAKAVTAKWPRTARLLNSLAETYEGFSNWHDISAERLDLEY
jgi:hypothetical protein